VSKGAQYKRSKNSHIERIKEVWENHTTNPSKGENKGGEYKRSVAQGERAKGAKDQWFDCQMPNSQESLGGLGSPLMEGGNLI
jgi:hypothetical protein